MSIFNSKQEYLLLAGLCRQIQAHHMLLTLCRCFTSSIQIDNLPVKALVSGKSSPEVIIKRKILLLMLIKSKVTYFIFSTFVIL